MTDKEACFVVIPKDPDSLPGVVEKHVTLAYLGEIPEAVYHSLKSAVDNINFRPFVARVSGNGVLGSDRAKVIFLESPTFNDLREWFLTWLSGNMRKAATTYPHFVPHMTLSYGSFQYTFPHYSSSISFSHVELWWGERRYRSDKGGPSNLEIIQDLERQSEEYLVESLKAKLKNGELTRTSIAAYAPAHIVPKVIGNV